MTERGEDLRKGSRVGLAPDDPGISDLMSDSCHIRCIGINKIYVLNPTTVAKLQQYSGSRVEHRDGFSLHK